MQKRVKSFLITASSLFFTAFVAVVLTPEWATFVTDVYVYLGQVGIPASIIAVLGLLVAEIWKAILNKRMANQEGFSSTVTASRQGLDLY